MDFTVEAIYALVTAIVTGCLGAILKNRVVPANWIPVQNFVIGIITSIIAICLGIFETPILAIVTSLGLAMAAGGTYDLTKVNNEEE